MSCCVNCLVASGSKAAGLRQFSKVRSLKRDFVDRCTFHCCCTLLQLCMLQKFEFYPNCRIRKCDSVFIKTLRPSWSYSSIRSSNILICKKILFTMCTAAVHLGLQFYWRIEVWIILLINLAWNYPQNELLVTFLVRNRTYEPFSPVYSLLILNFCTQGFLWGVLLCLKTGSWKEMNRVIFLWMRLFFYPSFLA